MLTFLIGSASSSHGATAHQALWCPPLHTKGPRMPIRIDRLARTRGGHFHGVHDGRTKNPPTGQTDGLPCWWNPAGWYPGEALDASGNHVAKAASN